MYIRTTTKILGICVLTAGLQGLLQAQVCLDNSVLGQYGFSATRQVMAALPTSQPTGSSPVEVLVNGATGTTPFTDIGSFYADGQGNLFVVDPQTSVRTQVGAYQVYDDCSIQLGFKLNTGGVPISLSNVDLTLVGLMVNGGNEIDLQPLPATTQSNTTQTSPAQMSTTPTSATAAAPVFMIMQRAAQTGYCTTQNVAGNFGLQASGFMSSTGASPFLSLGRFRADGAGNLTTNLAGGSSSLPGNQFTGNYQVNQDCTGTATLVAGDGTSRSISFVVVSDPNTQRARLLFAYLGSTLFGGGAAMQQ